MSQIFYKKNQEKPLKACDAFGIYARNRLRAYENKFSSPLSFSLHYRKRLHHALREKQ